MYALINRTGCTVHQQLLLDANAEEQLLIVVKASFLIAGERLTPRPAKIVLADRYHGDPLRSSLAAAGEVVLHKPRPDLLLAGNAYPARAGDSAGHVSFRVGAWSKAAAIVGDRTWTRGLAGLRPSAPRAFDVVPLRYERAFGGADLDASPPVGSLENPVGVGQVPAKEGAPLPNIEHPEQLLRAAGERPPACSFGPIPPHWEPRRGLHGTFGDAWLRTRMPLPPHDADPRAAQCAPPDQVYPEPLRGDEEVELHGVRPGGAALAFRLPGLQLRVFVHDGDGPCELTTALDTLHIDAAAPRVDLTWRASFSVHERLEAPRWVLVEAIGGAHG